jgi:hypothetical protein
MKKPNQVKPNQRLESTATGSKLTGHDLESVEPLPLESRDDVVRAALQVGRPRLDVVEDVHGAAPGLARSGVGRVPAEHLAVHGLEVDGGHGERPVHVEHDPSQRPPPLGRSGGGGHGPPAEAAGGSGAARWRFFKSIIKSRIVKVSGLFKSIFK